MHRIPVRRTGRRTLVAALTAAALVAVALAAVATPVAAHGGTLRASGESLAVPTWLFLLTGGAVVGASFLLASFVTDRALVQSVDTWGRRYGIGATVARAARAGGKLVGVLGVVAILAFGLFGPANPLANLAVLLVWVGWWAGYVASVYLLGNTWPTLNPFRTVVSALPALDRPFPERVGAWPSVAGLLVLVWVEVVSPLADDPRLLAMAVATYGLLTVSGGLVFGDEWFEAADPVSRVFRYYGRVAPFGPARARADGGDADRSDGGDRPSGIAARLPGMDLTRIEGVDGLDEVAFVVAVVWVTTYDGLVTTPAWRDLAEAVVGAGIPAQVLYPVAMLTGYGAFLGLYLVAAGYARETGETYRTRMALARRFAPSLLAIAAGYHLAHYLGYFLSLSPALVGALSAPFAPPAPQVLVLPGWFKGLSLTFVLLGHLVAIWVAHAAAYDTFPGRLQAVRSQYPFIAVMVVYTMLSLWIVAEPETVPPFL